GITRHIPDEELRALLISGRSPAEICDEMKRRCYQRGAEENLTAVIVNVGTPKFEGVGDEERTLSFDRFEAETETPPPPAAASETTTRCTPAARIAFPAPGEAQAQAAAAPARTSTGRSVLRFFVFLLFLAVAVGAFYGGIKYQEQQAKLAATAQ